MSETGFIDAMLVAREKLRSMPAAERPVFYAASEAEATAARELFGTAVDVVVTGPLPVPDWRESVTDKGHPEEG